MKTEDSWKVKKEEDRNVLGVRAESGVWRSSDKKVD